MNKPTFSRMIAGLALLVSLALLGNGCAPRKASAGGGKPAAVPVQVGQAVRQTLPVKQTAIGSVQSLRSVAVKSQVDGVIQKINFREGDEVKAGDLLVTLDRRPFENSLLMARADLANARANNAQAQTDAQRYQQLDQAAVVSKEQYSQLLAKAESAKALMESREAAVANAELQLGYTEIRAPINGRTGQLMLHEGSLVKANDTGQSILLINQLAPISVAYSVPENTLDDVQAAMTAGPVTVTVNVHGDASKSVQGRLDFVDNAVDPSTGTILLKAVFENADRALWPGQFVDVAMRVGDEVDAVLVPAAAVKTGQRGSQIFVIKPDHTVDLRNAKIGRTAEGLTVVREGVQPGETVVVDGQLRLLPGVTVEVKPAVSEASTTATAANEKPAKAGS